MEKEKKDIWKVFHLFKILYFGRNIWQFGDTFQWRITTILNYYINNISILIVLKEKTKRKELFHAYGMESKYTYLFFCKNLFNGPSSAISITNIQASASHIPIIRTIYGLSSCCITLASLSNSSFMAGSLLSFFKIFTATGLAPLQKRIQFWD